MSVHYAGDGGVFYRRRPEAGAGFWQLAAGYRHSGVAGEEPDCMGEGTNSSEPSGGDELRPYKSLLTIHE